MLHAVTVYCSSSADIAPRYFEAGAKLGRAIAQNHWNLVYGGNAVGLMKTVADSARAAGGKVIGVTPRLFVDMGVADNLCDELVLTNDMRDRKAVLAERGDAFVALPGGLGTFEELLDILVSKQLGYINKPLVIVNLDNFYAPLLAMLELAIGQNFIRAKVRNLFHVSSGVDDAVQFLLEHQRPQLIRPHLDPLRPEVE